MPWTAKDAKKKNSSIKSDKEARMWVTVANSTLKALLEKGTDRATAERRAIQAAHASVRKMHAKGGGEKKEGYQGNDELLTEYIDNRGAVLSVDREAGVIRGVKILGPESRNGRYYPKETMANAAPLYEGAKVNVNHPEGDPTKPRLYEHRIGRLEHVELRQGNDGLFADFRFNPKHALAEQLLWDAEHSPESVGFSHNVAAKCSRRDGRVIVEQINCVQSVDLVADPATTSGLFEDIGSDEIEEETYSMEGITLEQLQVERPDLLRAHADAVLKEQAQSEEAKAKDAELTRLREENDRYKAAEEMAKRKAAIEEEIKAAKLPNTLVTEVFRDTLYRTEEKEKRDALIEERRKIAGMKDVGKPQSREQTALSEGAQTNTEGFIDAVSEEGSI